RALALARASVELGLADDEGGLACRELRLPLPELVPLAVGACVLGDGRGRSRGGGCLRRGKRRLARGDRRQRLPLAPVERPRAGVELLGAGGKRRLAGLAGRERLPLALPGRTRAGVELLGASRERGDGLRVGLRRLVELVGTALDELALPGQPRL